MKIRHQIYAVIAILISFLRGAALTPAFANDSDCWEKTGDAKLRACTRIITTGKLNGKPAHKDDIATMYRNRGDVFVQKRDYDRAIADYTQAIALNPNDLVAYDQRGLAYADKGDYDRAIADHTKAMSIDPKHPFPPYNRGKAYWKKGDIKRAIADFRKTLELDPSDKDAKAALERLKASASQSAGDDSDCWKKTGDARFNACSRIINLKRLSGQPISRDNLTLMYVNRANSSLERGDYDYAISDLSQAMSLNPNLAAAYIDRGVAYHKKRDYGRAIADATKAIALDPKNALPYNNRADAYLASDQPSRGLPDAKRAVALGSDNKHQSAFLAKRGQIYAALRRRKEAITDLQKAFGLDPNLGGQPDDPDLKEAKKTLARLKGFNAAQAADGCHPDNTDLQNRIRACTRVIEEEGKKSQKNLLNAYVSRGAARAESDELDGAISDMTDAIRMAPKSWLLYTMRGKAHHDKRHYNRAITDFTEAIGIRSNFADAYLGRASVYYDKGDYNRAIADYTEVIKLSPKDAKAYYNRALSYRKKNNYDRAIADYTKAINLNPKYADAYNNRADAYLKLDQPSQGLPDAERAVEIRANDPIYLATRGQIYAALRRREEAIRDLKRALELDPSQKDASKTLERLTAAPPEARSQANIDCLQDNACSDGETTALAAFNAFCFSTQLDHDRLKAALSHYRSTSNPTGAGYLVIASGSNFIVEMRTIENKNGGSRRRCDITGPSLSLKRLRKLVEQSYAASYLGEKETETGTKLAFSAANLAGLPDNMAIIVESIASPQHGVLPTTRFALLEIN